MISVIISSHNTEYFNIVSKSINETIGTEYEIIKIENHARYGLSEAYNIGITQAKFDILCFCHEDIIFHTKNWGTIVLDMFLHERALGIIGIAGAANKSKAPSSWWGTYSDLQFMNIIHGESNSLYEYENEFEGPIEKQRMALIDGVFMCIRKDNKIFFNPLFKDFHFYDISLCMEYNIRNYTIRCTDKILIQHYSKGSVNQKWLEEADRFYKLYKDYLPINFSSKKYSENKLEIRNLIQIIFLSLKFDNFKIAAYYWKILLSYSLFLKTHLRIMYVFLKKISVKIFKNRSDHTGKGQKKRYCKNTSFFF